MKVIITSNDEYVTVKCETIEQAKKLELCLMFFLAFHEGFGDE